MIGVEPSKHFCDVSFQVLTKNEHRINRDQNILRRLYGIPNTYLRSVLTTSAKTTKRNKKNSSDLLKDMPYSCSPLSRLRQQLNFQKEQYITQHTQLSQALKVMLIEGKGSMSSEIRREISGGSLLSALPSWVSFLHISLNISREPEE